VGVVAVTLGLQISKLAAIGDIRLGAILARRLIEKGYPKTMNNQELSVVRCGELISRLKDIVPRVSSVEYQKPNKGYVKIGHVLDVTMTQLLGDIPRSPAQFQELVEAMAWLGYEPRDEGWEAVTTRRRGNYFDSEEAAHEHRRLQIFKGVLRHRLKLYQKRLEELS
jgi:hypothetical protein